jgi:hypothetical protein
MIRKQVKPMLAGIVVACTFAAVGVQSAWAAPPDDENTTTRPVVDFPTRTLVFGESTLTRSDDGIKMQFKATNLPAGAYSAWMPIFEPGGTTPVVAGWVGGHVIGEGGNLAFSVHLKEDEVISGHPVFPSGSLEDAHGHDIGMVIRYHGPVDPQYVYEQTHTFEPGVAIDALFTIHRLP